MPFGEGTTVIFVMGSGRSGSTLLDNLLGAIPGVFSTGELHFFWQRGLLEGRLCGCGVPVPSCEFWSQVLDALAVDDAEAHDIVRWQQHELRMRHIRRLLRHDSATLRSRSELSALVGVTERLYRAIRDVSGNRVIVDSSKLPADAALLRLLPNVRPHVVHLVRDPRAVTYSWNRVKEDPAADRAKMARMGSVRAAGHWLALNVAAERVRRALPEACWQFVKYEELASDPQAVVRSILSAVGLGGDTTLTQDDGMVELGPNHTVGGNPRRFAAGPIRIATDDEWQHEIKLSSWLIATAIAAPLLHRYGYALWDRDAAPAHVE